MKLAKLDTNKHDLNEVAGLIYETDAKAFDFYFKNKENASKRIEKLIKAGNNNMGYEKIYVVTETEDDDQVYGVLVTEIGEEENIKNDFGAYFKTLNLWDALKLVFLDIGDMLIGVKLNRDDYYLADVAVDEQCRGKGIGTFILEESLELAREKGCKRVVLDVDLENEGALKLYERFGFKIFKKRSVRWFDGKKGVYNMEYRLNSERDV